MCSPSKLFPTNVTNLNQSKDAKEYTFKMIYNQALREEALKNPVRKLNRLLNRKHISISIGHSNSNSESRLSMPHFNTDQYNIDKKIKEIRKRTKAKDLDTQRKENKIAFSKEEIDIVFESTRLLEEIKKRKTNSLNDEDTSVATFLSDNKEIAIKNVLIKLLKSESKKIKNTEEDINSNLDEGHNSLMNQQETFNDLIEKQKGICKEIENILFDVQRSNYDLAETEKGYKVAFKLMEEEVEKYLDLINNKRICAKFIHQVMKQEKESQRFATEILLKGEANTAEQGTKKSNYSVLARQVM